MRTPTLLAALAVLTAVLVFAALLLVDTYSASSCNENGCIDTSSTLVEKNGMGVLIALAVPLVLTSVTFALIVTRGPRALAWAASGLLLLGCIIAGFGIGIAFLPSAALLLAAVASDRRPPKPEPAHDELAS